MEREAFYSWERKEQGKKDRKATAENGKEIKFENGTENGKEIENERERKGKFIHETSGLQASKGNTNNGKLQI